VKAIILSLLLLGFLDMGTSEERDDMELASKPVPTTNTCGEISAPDHVEMTTPKAQPSGIDNLEKPPFLYNSTDGCEDAFADDDPRVRGIPAYVRRVVSFTDDPTLPTLTFRYFLLTLLFVAPGAFMAQLSNYRTTYAPYSIFFVQIASSYVGAWMAKVLPALHIRIPGTKTGFSLNPGPFSVKEHVLVTISAASGATYNLAYTPISMAELYFDYTVHPAAAIFFMWAIVWVGYSYAVIGRQFLIYDPQYPW
jgi:hypothetical protein